MPLSSHQYPRMRQAVVIGASHAAAHLVPRLYKEGWDGQITLIGEEPYLPYQRPPLSKAFLAGEMEEERLVIRPKDLYDRIGVNLRLGTKVLRIDRAEKRVLLDDGEWLDYTKLALTVGARVRPLTVPGCDLKNVFYLRNILDVNLIKEKISESKKVVIIGGGFIGLETAAVFQKLGLDVTVLEMLDRVLQRVTAPEVSSFYERLHRAQGVEIFTRTAVLALEGDGHVQQVVCSGGKILEADMVVVGIGVKPNIELARDAGLEVADGIVVDDLARTSDPDIVAAGDCTCHPNAFAGGHVRLESVQNATDQAATAAATMCGKEKPYRVHPWFWSDQYDVSLQIAGLNKGYDQVLFRGDYLHGRKFVAWYLKNGELIAADCINSQREYMFTRRLLDKGISPDPEHLVDAHFDLKTLL